MTGMIANIAGVDGIIVLIVALVVLVGGSQLPKIARNIGLAGKEFRNAQAEAEEEKKTKASVPPPVALPASPSAGPAAVPAPAVAPPTAAGGEDSITLTPAQLEALIKAREEQARNQPQPGSN